MLLPFCACVSVFLLLISSVMLLETLAFFRFKARLRGFFRLEGRVESFFCLQGRVWRFGFFVVLNCSSA